MSEQRAFLEDLTAAQSAEDLWTKHCAKMAEYGFDRIIYGFSHFMSKTSLGDPDDFVLWRFYLMKKSETLHFALI